MLRRIVIKTEIAPNVRLPESSLAFHPDRASDCEVHPLLGMLRFGPHSASLVPGRVMKRKLGLRSAPYHFRFFM